MYDVLAGKENMEHSYLMSKSRALEAFPMLKSDGLVGALVYYDGGLYDVFHPTRCRQFIPRPTQRLAYEHGARHDRGQARCDCR
jgi:hypothetical protein